MAKQIAPLLKVQAELVRLRPMSLIASHPGGEACVCDLTGVFELSQPTIGHHLAEYALTPAGGGHLVGSR